MIIEIEDLSMAELEPFTCTSEARLIDHYGADGGIFIAESPKVILTALDSGYEPVSVLAERKCISSQGAGIADRCADIPVYTADSELLTRLTGYKMTKGILCAMKRKPLKEPGQILKNARRIAVLEDIMNQTNIGAVFRSAAALGIDAVLLTSSCSDPLFRRTIRVSMGTVFQLPWAYLAEGSPEYVRYLGKMGFTTAAMALRNDTVSIADPELHSAEKLAIILGTEGSGLKDSTISACDFTVKIPMYNGVDSLNVAAAGAIAFWEMKK